MLKRHVFGQLAERIGISAGAHGGAAGGFGFELFQRGEIGRRGQNGGDFRAVLGGARDHWKVAVIQILGKGRGRQQRKNQGKAHG